MAVAEEKAFFYSWDTPTASPVSRDHQSEFTIASRFASLIASLIDCLFEKLQGSVSAEIGYRSL
jgi:hypothetical protein